MTEGHRSAMRESNVSVRAGEAIVQGTLAIPDPAIGMVLFAHGSGSSRHSPRNRFVAQVLRRAGLGTLLLDLLTSDEEREDIETGRLRFDIERLARRLVGATDWLLAQPSTQHLPIVYFGASTGAAAALVAAAERPDVVRAVVSRGGRPDLAGAALSRVQAPVLLIVGSRDYVVIDLNREAMHKLQAAVELVIIPGATHLFEEPGALERVAEVARDFLVRQIVGVGGHESWNQAGQWQPGT